MLNHLNKIQFTELFCLSAIIQIYKIPTEDKIFDLLFVFIITTTTSNFCKQL